MGWWGVFLGTLASSQVCRRLPLDDYKLSFIVWFCGTEWPRAGVATNKITTTRQYTTGIMLAMLPHDVRIPAIASPSRGVASSEEAKSTLVN